MSLLTLAILAGCGGDGGSGRDPDAAPDAAAPPDAGVAPPDAGPWTGTIVGRVTSGGSPVPGATVRFGGRPELAITANDGAFTLTIGPPAIDLARIALTAGKPGYWNAGVQVGEPGAAQEIEIEAIALVDDPDYVYKSPDQFDSAPHCMHCHPNQYIGWSTSAHSRAASDPMLHDLYNGTASGIATEAECLAAGGAWRRGKAYGVPGAVEKCYVEGGALLADLNPGACGGPLQPTCDDPDAVPPADPGPCADCHAPASDAHVAGATNLNHVSGIAFDKGIHCDFCHKIAEVTVNERPGLDGAIRLLRPAPPMGQIWSDPEIFFGPYSDVIVFFMGATPQPQMATSEFCSACHQWSEPGFRPEDQPLVDLTKWPDGLPIQDTYHEWTQSPWATAGAHCRNCHEPGAPWETATIDLPPQGPDPFGTRGWAREYGEVRDHVFAARLGPAVVAEAPGDPSRDGLRDPIDLVVTPVRNAGAIDVTVSLGNARAGHSIPSGTPSRSLLLLVQAEAPSGELTAIGGYSIPAWVGAWAAGELGTDSTLVGTELSRAAGSWPADVAPGARIRFVRASGAYDDYPATRWFGDPARTPAEKGMEIVEPIATATVVDVVGDRVTLDRVVAALPGDRWFAGPAAPTGGLAVDDELLVTPLAGAPGYAFGKVMRDRFGQDGVVFFRAVDVASDNRIPSGATATTTHRFDTAGDTGEVAITVTLIYRKHPWSSVRARGWDAVDVVRKHIVVTVP